MSSKLRIDLIASLILKKAIAQREHVSACAEFCVALNLKTKVSAGVSDNFQEFRRILLNKCQNEFNSLIKTRKHQEAMERESDEDEQKPLGEHKKANKKRTLGLVRFIGEIYLKKLLVFRVIKYCIARLSQSIDQHPIKSDFIEPLCELLKTIGNTIEKKENEGGYVDSLFERLEDLSNELAENETLECRHGSIIIRDVIALRQSGWEESNNEDNDHR
uniref:MIF4G domain-containing protein n=1 Tax=Lotharella oceanica TaxID=641309 RepID=A0A7S2U253_9EUKA|mmetsp:Transcript_6849/g.13580  ORF Transcript_6849/g.13580 Transcript_6849/m.13580 type:complete len:218 (+) Transcript_6849:142-795(+)